MLGKIEVELLECMGSDRSIAESAWTSSFDKGKKELKTDEDVKRVVKMLITLGHSVPVESVVFRFWMRIPIFVDRQHMTHRIASHSGLSGRYRTLPEDWYSIPEDVCDIFTKAGYYTAKEEFDDIMEAQQELYRRMLNHLRATEKSGRIANHEYKRAREVIRGVIGTAAMTERVTVMNLRSFANYIRLRTDSHAQPEIQELARKMLAAVEERNICPVAIETLKRNGWRV